jgi:hypothetical protein
MYSLPGSVSAFGNKLRCYLFDNVNIMFTSVFASQAGLIVITIERYFKLVHPIIHRNRFRRWMIKMGLILPWINGVIVSFIPTVVMTDMINGICKTSGSYSLGGKVFLTARFFWQILIPIAIFVYCYWKIVASINRKLTISPGNVVFVKPCGSSSQTEGSTQHGWISQTQRNAIRTMITVVVCYSVCWSLPVFSTTLYLYYPTQALSSTFQLFGFFGYVNMLINPVIYSTHLGTVKRIQRALQRLFKVNDRRLQAETTTMESYSSTNTNTCVRNEQLS